MGEGGEEVEDGSQSAGKRRELHSGEEVESSQKRLSFSGTTPGVRQRDPPALFTIGIFVKYPTEGASRLTTKSAR